MSSIQSLCMSSIQSLCINMVPLQWPQPFMPEWANTVAKRMLDMHVEPTRIRETIIAMEKQRRKMTRKLLGIKPTEWDETITRMINSGKF